MRIIGAGVRVACMFCLTAVTTAVAGELTVTTDTPASFRTSSKGGDIDLAAAAGSDVGVAALLASEIRQVRAMDGQAKRLLSDGVRRSRTFAALVSAIHSTDVIVYIESTNDLPARMGGRLLLQAVTGQDRYLRVQVQASLRHSEGIEVLAHELRHVLEVAAEPSVIDAAGLVALYRRIGYRTFGDRGYDTDAAKRTGHTVRNELSRRTLSSGPHAVARGAP